MERTKTTTSPQVTTGRASAGFASRRLYMHALASQLLVIMTICVTPSHIIQPISLFPLSYATHRCLTSTSKCMTWHVAMLLANIPDRYYLLPTIYYYLLPTTNYLLPTT